MAVIINTRRTGSDREAHKPWQARTVDDLLRDAVQRCHFVQQQQQHGEARENSRFVVDEIYIGYDLGKQKQKSCDDVDAVFCRVSVEKHTQEPVRDTKPKRDEEGVPFADVIQDPPTSAFRVSTERVSHARRGQNLVACGSTRGRLSGDDARVFPLGGR